MPFRLLTVDEVIYIHDSVLNPNELAGLAMNKSLEGALGRIDFRLDYGLISDVFDLGSAYAIAIATGHVFNDANKRTALQAMMVSMKLNGLELTWPTEVIGDKIRDVAQGKVDEIELANWLRSSKRFES